VERLVGDGTSVRALARSEASARRVADLGAEPVSGDLADRAAIAAGAQGCDTAFHLAAHLGEWGPWEEFERGNVEGTRNVLDACAEAGVEREALNLLLLRTADIGELAESGRLRLEGDGAKLGELLGLLDEPDPGFAIVTR